MLFILDLSQMGLIFPINAGITKIAIFRKKSVKSIFWIYGTFEGN